MWGGVSTERDTKKVGRTSWQLGGTFVSLIVMQIRKSTLEHVVRVFRNFRSGRRYVKVDVSVIIRCCDGAPTAVCHGGKQS